jgi:glycosyltransferase involved in cell wall biosynthesis
MRKNILIFGHSYATQFIDISNQYTRLFDKNKYHVTVAYLVGEPNEQVRKKHLADEVIFLNPPKKAVRGLKISVIKQVLALCRQKGFEIVICHRYKPTYIMLWVNRYCRIPVIFSVMHELGTLNHLGRKVLIASLAKDNIIFAGVSDAVRNDLQRSIWKIPPERVITLHNMIDVEYTQSKLLDREAARNELQLDANSFLFGNIGRLAINKDQKTLLKAFATIKPKCPNAKLIILGDGQLETELKQLAKALHISNEVVFTGFVPHGFRFIPAFDVLISSSIQEAFGRVLLEAMIAKTPIIATSVNGVPEVIGDSGPLIPAADVKALAKEMLLAYQASQTERHRWGNQGYERALNHFSLQRFNEIFWQLPMIRKREPA